MTMKNEDYLRQVQRSIGEGDLEEAFESFQSYFSLYPERQEGHDATLIQSGRYMQLKRDRESGTLDSRQFNLEMNSIRQNILSLVREEEGFLATLDSQHTKQKSKHEALEEAYSHSLVRVWVLRCLLDPSYLDKGLDIGSLTRICPLGKRRLVVAVLNELEESGLLERYKDQGLTHNKLSPMGIKQFEKFRNLLNDVRLTNQKDVQ